MARAISYKTRKNVQAETSPLIKIFLITLKHPDLKIPIRVSSDPTTRVSADEYGIYYGTVSNGEIYYYAGFDASLANDESGAAPSVNLTIPNASRAMVAAIDSIYTSNPIKCDISIVFNDTPDVLEVSLVDMDLTNITWDESTISGTLTRDLLFTEPYPCRTFNPQDYPSLFNNKTR